MITISSILGKFMQASVFRFKSMEDSKVWIGLKDFYSNIGSVFLGFFKLLNALYYESDTKIFSERSFFQMPNLILLIFISCGFILSIICFKNTNNRVKEKLEILYSVLAINFLMFAFSVNCYGTYIFEERYFISMFLIVLILFVVGLSYIDDKYSLFKKSIFAILTICIFSIFSLSYIKYFNTNNNYIELKNLLDSVNNAKVAVFYGNRLNIDARNARVIDKDIISKSLLDDFSGFHHWGDYTYYDDILDNPDIDSVMIYLDEDIENLGLCVDLSGARPVKNGRFNIVYIKDLVKK